jgi:diketogulonate reductase-like aldo/keto reductase
MTEHQHSLPSPALVQHHLHGVHYPASRDDLISYARGQCEGGDHPNEECERVVQVLSQLPDREYRRPTDVNKAFGELARNYLERASYPAGRDDLVASARDQGADDVVLETIIMIPSQEYRNPDAVIVEIETSAVLGATLASPMRTIVLPSGDRFPVLGQGTWHLAEVPARRNTEIAALRRGLDIGMTLIDTAEMYADGAAEILVGEAMAGRRDSVFLVTKVLPHHATRLGTVRACQDSLRRLDTDRIDLYLLHWRGNAPLAQTVEAFIELRRAGLIRNWGVSNFDTPDLGDLVSLPGGQDVATNQVLYNVSRRGPEFDLLPTCRDLGIPIMAYSPIEQGRILGSPVLRDIGARHGASPAQVALAWVLRLDHVCAIPRSSRPEHADENRAALDVHLDQADLDLIDRAFPPPLHARPLEML